MPPGHARVNPSTAGGLSHLRTAGGGGGDTYVPLPANSKTTQRIGCKKYYEDYAQISLSMCDVAHK